MILSKYQNGKALRKLDIKKWKLVKFRDVLIDETSKAIKIKKENYSETGEFPIIDQGKEFIAGYTSSHEGLYKNAPLIIFGDHTRVIKYIDFPIYIGADGVKLLKNRFSEDEVLTKYLYYYLCTVNIPNTGYNRHFKYLKEIVFPIPSIDIQKQIITILDKAQNLIEKRKAQIEALNQLMQNVFLEMFGDPVNNLKGWSQLKLNDICTKITDGTHDTPKRLTSGIMLITGKNIRPFKIDFSDLDYVSKEDHEIIYSRCNPEYGDILYTNIGANLGTATMNNLHEQFSMKNVALLKLKRELVNSRYIEFLLNNLSMKNKIIDLSSSGGAQKFLSLNKIKQVEVPVPPLDIQVQFSVIVEELLRKKVVFEKGLFELEKLFNSLIQRAFRGELFN